MKKYIRKPIFCGISGHKYVDGKYHFKIDFEKNSDKDAIQFINPYFKESRLAGANIYWFGYQFNGSIDREYRDACIQYLKNVQPEDVTSDFGINEIDLYNMIERSMRNIRLDNLSVDAIVYPISSTNNLVKYIARSIRRYLNEPSKLTMHEIIKADPANITLDIERCLIDIEDGNLDDHEGLINEDYLYELQDTIRSRSDFSLRRDIHPTELRWYIQNFVQFRQVTQALISADKILIVDDFKTTGATLSDIIRIITQYNKECQIYVFTLLGNNRSALSK